VSVQLGAKRCLLDDSIMQVDVRGDVREAIFPEHDKIRVDLKGESPGGLVAKREIGVGVMVPEQPGVPRIDGGEEQWPSHGNVRLEEAGRRVGRPDEGKSKHEVDRDGRRRDVKRASAALPTPTAAKEEAAFQMDGLRIDVGGKAEEIDPETEEREGVEVPAEAPTPRQRGVEIHVLEGASTYDAIIEFEVVVLRKARASIDVREPLRGGGLASKHEAGHSDESHRQKLRRSLHFGLSFTPVAVLRDPPGVDPAPPFHPARVAPSRSDRMRRASLDAPEDLPKQALRQVAFGKPEDEGSRMPDEAPADHVSERRKKIKPSLTQPEVS
jgi:hypothetical protein